VDNNLHFSSATGEWSTPQDLFDHLNEIFDFDLDAAATRENTKCSHWFTKEDDALIRNWTSFTTTRAVWLNPPDGRGLIKWIEKASTEAMKGLTVVCLLPARTDTAWFQMCKLRGEIRFLRGRLKFGGHKNAAPFPSMIVVFDKFLYQMRELDFFA
jgi:phage N-6-adenine-methyltransferase